MRSLQRILKILILIVAILAAIYGVARWQGVLVYRHEIAPAPYEVFGIDASSYQGKLDWEQLMAQQVRFAFLKATEGSNLKDSSFAENWTTAQEAGLRVGAYHFFSYDSTGKDQADNFISMVPITEGALPPVIDIEFYGRYLDQPKATEEAVPILADLLTRLEAHYGQKPILYVTDRSYRLYVKGNFDGYPLWVSFPTLSPVWLDWDFWQYSHYAVMDGYAGPEQYIDLNVFRGSREELARFGLE